MANEWNVAYPIDHTLISAVPGEIRKLKDSCKDQIDREHETPVDGDATGGEHSSGSAVAYEGTSTPANRPDGATALADNAIDRGRLWLDDNSDPPSLKRWDGSAFETVLSLGGYSIASYGGEESLTLPNGLIIKMGYNSGGSNKTVTFGAAFPTGIVAVSVTQKRTDLTSQSATYAGDSVSGFTIYCGDALATGYSWIAIGY